MCSLFDAKLKFDDGEHQLIMLVSLFSKIWRCPFQIFHFQLIGTVSVYTIVSSVTAKMSNVIVVIGQTFELSNIVKTIVNEKL